MKDFNNCLYEMMGLNTEYVQNMVSVEGLNGYGAYKIINNMLRHHDNYRMPLSSLSAVARVMHTSVRYLLKIVRNYGLYVVEGDEFFCPEISDLLLRLQIKKYTKSKNFLHSKSIKGKSTEEVQKARKASALISKLVKELNDCKLKAAYARGMINYNSQFKLREREKEKRENAFGGRQENSLAARNFSQQEMEANDLGNLEMVYNQAEDNCSSKVDIPPEANPTNELNVLQKANASQEVGVIKHLGASKHNVGSKQNASSPEITPSPTTQEAVLDSVSTPNSASDSFSAYAQTEEEMADMDKLYGRPKKRKNAKSWKDLVDEMGTDDKLMNQMAKQTGLEQAFFEYKESILEIFKKHVEEYGNTKGLIKLNDVRFYFANFMKRDSKTLNMVIKKLYEIKEAREAANPYRFEKLVDGVRMYPHGNGSGDVIPDEAPPRPSMYAVWSEVSKSWVG